MGARFVARNMLQMEGCIVLMKWWWKVDNLPLFISVRIAWICLWPPLVNHSLCTDVPTPHQHHSIINFRHVHPLGILRHLFFGLCNCDLTRCLKYAVMQFPIVKYNVKCCVLTVSSLVPQPTCCSFFPSSRGPCLTVSDRKLCSCLLASQLNLKECLSCLLLPL